MRIRAEHARDVGPDLNLFDVERGSVGVQIFTLGILFAVLGVLSDGLYALGELDDRCFLIPTRS